MTADPRLLAEIRETHRMHQDLLRAEKRLEQQIAAIKRRAGANDPEAPIVALPPAGAGAAAPRSRHLSGETGGRQASGHRSLCASGHPSLSEPRCRSATDAQMHGAAGSTSASESGSDPSGSAGHMQFDAQVEHAGGAASFSMAALLELAVMPLDGARAEVRRHQLQLRRRLQKLAAGLPVAAWVDGVKGFGLFGLAQIVAEAGDLSRYDNPAKLWKRMGLAVIEGRAQRRVAGADALEHGFNPARRSIMFCIGDSLIKKQNPYRDLYLARKAVEEATSPDLTKMHRHRRAQRYMEKRLLRDLWRAWRDLTPKANERTQA